ncbi:hypothetical protein K9B33_21010 [Sphingobium sp. 3R8]|uniref:hypothetical protein n=1 Tax=Sphingobium sp. 3R8 TaxID=2874921 RepID=UPI001CC9757B|nr:hypothetical protein [Sphingobium sp. 3R8]MBZ9650018.1 hypothetical protein [Sphingobium sp. 3R8]
MEEKRPGQHPDEELTEATGKDGSAFSPRPSDDKPTAMERELLRRAQKRADADREDARRTGHGDHQGELGF